MRSCEKSTFSRIFHEFIFSRRYCYSNGTMLELALTEHCFTLITHCSTFIKHYSTNVTQCSTIKDIPLMSTMNGMYVRERLFLQTRILLLQDDIHQFRHVGNVHRAVAIHVTLHIFYLFTNLIICCFLTYSMTIIRTYVNIPS